MMSSGKATARQMSHTLSLGGSVVELVTAPLNMPNASRPMPASRQTIRIKLRIALGINTFQSSYHENRGRRRIFNPPFGSSMLYVRLCRIASWRRDPHKQADNYEVGNQRGAAVAYKR